MTHIDTRLAEAIAELDALTRDDSVSFSVMNNALNKLIRAARAARAMRRIEAVRAARAQTP